MRLQVQVLPLNDKRFTGKASSPSITQNQQHSNLPQGALSFLEVCDDGITLDELCSKLCARFARIYPHKPPLNIKKLQDVYENDLDLVYAVGDVFDDKSTDQRNSVVRVLQAPATRDSSVPPQSALRPHFHSFTSRKRALGGLSNLREGITAGGGEAKVDRASKRRRLRDLMIDEDEEVDPDRPIPSQELNSKDTAKLTQYTGNELRVGQEASPDRVIDTVGANSHPSGKPNHQTPSETLTVPESPNQQSRIQPTNNQSLRRKGLAGDPHNRSAKSESDDEDSHLLHSIPRSSIGSPFLEGEGIVKERLAIASQGPAPLSTPKTQKFRGSEISGNPQSIVTPSSTPKPPAVQSPSKLKRPNPSMFKSSSRSTGSAEEASNIYDAIETDEGGSPNLSSVAPRLAKRTRRHSSFTSIMNGQSPLPSKLGSGGFNRSPGLGDAVARRDDKKTISPSEVKWPHDHEELHCKSHSRDGKWNSKDRGGSNHVLTKGDKESKVGGRLTKEQIWREGRGKAMEEQGKKAMAVAERERLERETEENTLRKLERIRQQRIEATESHRRASEKATQEAKETQRKEEEDKNNRRRQKGAIDERRREEEKQCVKEVGDKKEAARLERMKREKEKQLENERQDQERKERAQRLAQSKALKAEKAEKEAEVKRLAKKNEEEKAAREAAEKVERARKEAEVKNLAKKNEEKAIREAAERVERARKEAEVKSLAKKNEEKTFREAAEKVEKAERGPEAMGIAKKKGLAKETAVKKPLEGVTRRKAQDVKQSRRLSTTPLFPRAATPRDAQANGYGFSSVPNAPVRNASPDPQIPNSSEQGAPMRHSTSFIVDKTQNNPNLSSSPILANSTPAPAPPQVPRKVTKVYPPGMGPDNLGSLASVPPEEHTAAAPKPKGKPPAGSAQAPNIQAQSSSNLEHVTNKATKGNSQGLIPKPTSKPAPTKEEIVISSEDSDSSSYPSDVGSESENIAATTTAKTTAGASAHIIPTTTKTDDKESVSSSVSTATSSRSRSRSHSKSLRRDPPRHVPSPMRSPVRRVSHSSSESEYSSSTSTSTSRSKSSSPSRSRPSSLRPSRSRSDSTGKLSSDDEYTEDDVSTSSQSPSRSPIHASKKLKGSRDEVGSKEAVDRLNGILRQNTKRSAEARGKEPSNLLSPVSGGSSQAKPSLNSFPSLSQLGSQSFDHGDKDHKNKTGSQKSHPRNGPQVVIKSSSLALLEESGSSSDESSSDDDSGDDNELPQDRRAGDAEPNSKVVRGFKGLISGMWNWRSSQGITD